MDIASAAPYVTRMDIRTTEMASPISAQAKFAIGQVVRHRFHPFRGVIYDVDPQFANTEDWWESIPEDKRPRKDQPFYHLLAENETTYYHAYVSEQNLVPDDSGEPVDHPEVEEYFDELTDGQYQWDAINRH
ncbi:MAG: heat shock protein HspQ [Paracoccaceae bacterium]